MNLASVKVINSAGHRGAAIITSTEGGTPIVLESWNRIRDADSKDFLQRSSKKSLLRFPTSHPWYQPPRHDHIWTALFKTPERLMVRSVLLNLTGTELIHDAMDTQLSSQRKKWSDRETDWFLAQYRQPFQNQLQWTQSEVRSLAEFHQTVELVSAQMVSSTQVRYHFFDWDK